MKHLMLLLGLFIPFSIQAQNCNIGNEDTLGFNSAGIFFDDALLGVKFNLSTPGTLTAVSLIGKNTGAQVQMAVYNDLNGVPNDLVAGTGVGTVGVGIVSLPVSPTPLTPGDYWIMAAYSTVDDHTYKNTNVPGNEIYHTFFYVGDSIPANASNFTASSGKDYTYFMEIDCGAVGTNDLPDAIQSIKVFPNPTSDNIQLLGLDQQGGEVIIYDTQGKQVKVQKVNRKTNQVDLHHLPGGTYLVTLNHVLVEKIIVK